LADKNSRYPPLSLENSGFLQARKSGKCYDYTKSTGTIEEVRDYAEKDLLSLHHLDQRGSNNGYQDTDLGDSYSK
jgi:hypothetical protein